MSGRVLRRHALLGAAALLGGCSSLDNIMGERKVRLPGDRRSVLRPEPPLSADAAEAGRVSLPAAEPVAAWPMTGGPPSHAPGNVAVGESLAIAWRSSIGSGSSYRQRIVTGPVIAEGVVYAVDAWGMVSATNLSDGRQRWRIDSTPEDESASPLGGGAAVADGVVYVATGAGEVMALDPASGSVRWRERLPSAARGAPTVVGGRIFVPTIENQLTAHSVEDGRRLWLHRAQVLPTVPLGLPAPAVEGEAVVAGFGSGELLALRASDGRLLWAESLGAVGRSSLADIVGITGLPTIAGGRVIAVGQGNLTIAVDLRSGRRLWERPFGGGAGVATAGDWAFAVTSGGDALAIGREDGAVSWVTTLDPEPPGGRRGDPARFGHPLVAGGRVLIPSTKGELLQLDPVGGEIIGRVPLGSSASLPMAVSDGTLVLLADDGTLIALR
ncbi:PQQ-binding-like beta-propeller repeat protein [Roseomonas sp. AR75]|uniref:outer membrane protein assembly factor BamB family protein n=1 Tax=Roseomonas sp. AR75 TaxID=2562311 RepID=UPI0010C000F5|nr:PQQ-binding-like beta-propeller repeat protein [Roseomonas sp. AR75]